MEVLTEDGVNKKKKTSDNGNKVSLSDINQLKTRIKTLGITFDEMNTIQVKLLAF